MGAKREALPGMNKRRVFAILHPRAAVPLLSSSSRRRAEASLGELRSCAAARNGPDCGVSAEPKSIWQSFALL
jgi:hypothetical protein